MGGRTSFAKWGAEVGGYDVVPVGLPPVARIPARKSRGEGFLGVGSGVESGWAATM